MKIHITQGTQNEIDSLYYIYESMDKCGQHFLVLEGGIAVGKTFLAQKLAESIVVKKDNIRLFQFHEGYSYENFVYGLQIETEAAKLKYTKGMQPLMEIIKECNRTNEKYVIIIDDMNRTNIMSTFGDLFTALESKEIGNAIKTDVGDITIPDNLFIIATMNPLVGKHPIDYAWFRRFTVVELKANKKYWEDNNISEDYKRYSDYSEEIFMHVRMLFDYYFTDQDNQKAKENYIPGHGLFLKYDDDHSLKENLVNLHDRLKYIVAPILEEYIRQGVLEEYARLDVKALADLTGNSISIKWNSKEKQSLINEFYQNLIVNSGLNSNALFFFLLHSSNDDYRVFLKRPKNGELINNTGMDDVRLCICESDTRAIEINKNYSAKRLGQDNLTVYFTRDSRFIIVDDEKYMVLSGTSELELTICGNKEQLIKRNPKSLSKPFDDESVKNYINKINETHQLILRRTDNE